MGVTTPAQLTTIFLKSARGVPKINWNHCTLFQTLHRNALRKNGVAFEKTRRVITK